jgi:hypothetical protein
LKSRGAAALHFMASRIRFENLSVPAFELVEKLREAQLSIPPHQREFSWPEKKQKLFLDTVQTNLPTSNILLRRNRDVESLEDGRQRITTLMEYFKPDSTLRDSRDRLFVDLPPEARRQMENYLFSVVRYSHASDEQAIEIFMRAQFGLPLTVGQLMYALAAISPLVSYASETLLTSGSGLHDRAVAVWGARNGKDPKRALFRDGVVLAMMAVFGEATKKWGEIEDKRFLHRALSPALKADATDRLTKLIRIYEQAELLHPTRGKALRNRQWSLGNFSAYILWSLHQFPEEHERLIAGWTNWLVEYRIDESLLETVLKRDVSQARSWNDQRWRRGYLRVFDPTSDLLPALPAAEGGEFYDDSSDD